MKLPAWLRTLDLLTVLVYALAAAMAVLSWDGLRAAALVSGAVHHPRLAYVWAGSVDALWIAAALSVRRVSAPGVGWGRRGAAIGVLLVGLAGSGMQVWYPPTWAARLVPPVGLALVLLLEVYVVRAAAGGVARPAIPPVTTGGMSDGSTTTAEHLVGGGDHHLRPQAPSHRPAGDVTAPHPGHTPQGVRGGVRGGAAGGAGAGIPGVATRGGDRAEGGEGGVIYSSPDEAWGAEGPFGYRVMMRVTGLSEHFARKEVDRLKATASTNGGGVPVR